MAFSSETIDKDSETQDNTYTRFIDDYYARKPKFTVAPDIDLSKHEKEEVIMPIQQKEEQSGDNLTDKVANDPNDSTSSSHDPHKEKAHAMDHHATPGPVIADNMPKPASKEELKARAAELNK